MEQPYEYRPLDPNRQEIRLFELLPATSPDARVCGTLFVVSLDENPEYDALSYVWGNQQSPLSIVINEWFVLAVGANLYNAMVDLRRRDKSRIIWVDGMCINQKDLKERGNQVQHMRHIYSEARTVRAWLDQHVDPASHAFADAFKALLGLGKDVTLADYTFEFWRPVLDILRNPYWTRLWVQQEFVLAKSQVCLHCCSDELPLKPFLALYKSDSHITGIDLPTLINSWNDTKQIIYPNAKQLRFDINDYLGPLGLIANMNYLHDYVWKYNTSGGNLQDLFHLFMASEHLKMSDSRDRVYGLLGLARDFDANDFEIRYDLDVVEVYSQVPQLCIKKRGSLEFLSMAGINSATASHPSWFPSYRMEGEFGRSCIAALNWQAAGSTTASNALIHSKGRGLRLRGFMVDRVGDMGSVSPLNAASITTLIQQLEWLCSRQCLERADTHLSREAICLLTSFFSERERKGYNQEEIKIFGKNVKPSYFSKGHDEEELFALSKSVLRKSVVFSKSNPHATLEDWQNSLHPSSYGFYGVLTTDEYRLLGDIRVALLGQAFIATAGGALGTAAAVPITIGPNGDEVWVLFGCPVPVILRPDPNITGRYSVVCSATIPSLMRGEACEGLAEDGTFSHGSGRPDVVEIDLF